MEAQSPEGNRFASSDLSGGEVALEINNLTRDGVKNEEVMNHYVIWAENYDKHVTAAGCGSYDQSMKEFKQLEIKKDARIMDVACGTGLLAEALVAIGYTNIDGLDGSQEMLNKAKEKNVYKKLQTTFFGADPVEGIEKDSYDVTFAVACLTNGHLEADAMRELIRITKPGGHVIMTMTELALASPAGYAQTVTTLAAEGKWKLISKNHYTTYESMSGYGFTLQVI